MTSAFELLQQKSKKLYGSSSRYDVFCRWTGDGLWHRDAQIDLGQSIHHVSDCIEMVGRTIQLYSCVEKKSALKQVLDEFDYLISEGRLSKEECYLFGKQFKRRLGLV